ncbi:Pre-mRNA-splicing factor CLF1 [Apiospora phragmitis]|uniref:Pre-mRNA-splicing factor CLF1 n=1 Tax=Apiospora phragmitis TaxID=2905665 RepID=A0ABR1TV14_9PEZI
MPYLPLLLHHRQISVALLGPSCRPELRLTSTHHQIPLRFSRCIDELAHYGVFTRPPRVKNKGAAPIQISAEQLLREAQDRQDTQGRKRKEFEDYVRRNRVNMNNWMRYAQWELEQKEYRRARSIFERALDVDSTSVVLWIRYIESEMKSRNINHARNLLDRSVSILPRVDKLWYKYVYMEEMLGNIPGTRQLEKRYGEFQRARDIFTRFTFVHPEPRNWIKWAKFEEEVGTSDLVRQVYSDAIEALGDEFTDEKIFVSWARFEAKLKEYERARAIYKHALDRLPRSKSMLLHKAYTTFEKQYGDQEGVEDVVLSKRRRHYEDQINQNSKNYDIWFDYARLEEAGGDANRVRDVYERAEMEAKDIGRARQIYDLCLDLIPHKKFTFAKIWLMKAHFEIRQGELTVARKTLGRSIGMCPKDKLFKGYVELEMKLYEFVRCRTLYEKHIEWNPSNSQAWINFAKLEQSLDDLERARAIYELATSQETLDMPELVWKAYIDFEEGEGEFERTRDLYERLLEKTEHVKVWISYAHFELNVPDANDNAANGNAEAEEEEPKTEAAKARARSVFERAHKSMKEKDLKEERVSLLNSWLAFERVHGADEEIEKVQKQMPRRVKKMHRLEDDTYEERIDYVFPADDEDKQDLSNMLAMAAAWKQGGGNV